jgi:peptidoglycan/xylan/chitin deacetylase (PgdA/CDA1 family)
MDFCPVMPLAEARHHGAAVKVEPVLAFSNDDLPDREADDDILPVLQQSALHSPFVVIEDRAVFGEEIPRGEVAPVMLARNRRWYLP